VKKETGEFWPLKGSRGIPEGSNNYLHSAMLSAAVAAAAAA
jgi:hypothetical protein